VIAGKCRQRANPGPAPTKFLPESDKTSELPLFGEKIVGTQKRNSETFDRGGEAGLVKWKTGVVNSITHRLARYGWNKRLSTPGGCACRGR
jgi:hypothetical protein